MPSQSKTDHVRKRCDCSKWKECTHPWYVDYQEGRRRYRPNLDILIGQHAADFTEAKKQARRAVDAWLNGRSAADLLPGDYPTLTTVLKAYGDRPNGAPINPYQRGRIVKTIVNGRAFGEWRVADITREMVESFRQQRPCVAGNRDLSTLRAAFNWAVLTGLVPATPFKVGTVAAVKLAREEGRTRRLQPGEDERLLLAANSLRDLLIAALETGCRLGELLSLQWEQVRGDLFLPAGKTKAKKPRRVPISTVLRAVLDGRRHDAAGDVLPSSAFVFGDEVGRRRGSIKTAWVSTVLRANGHTPKYVKSVKKGKRVRTLAPESRAHLRGINLHFHDLRREAGSRWMDAGVPLATIQRWLGHHNISQTSTYLAASGGGDSDAMRAFEQAVGRVTRSDASVGSDGRSITRSGSESTKKTQSNAVECNPTEVVH